MAMQSESPIHPHSPQKQPVLFSSFSEQLLPSISISVTIRILISSGSQVQSTILTLSFRHLQVKEEIFPPKRCQKIRAEAKEVDFPGNLRDWQWLDARLCTSVMGAQTFSFLSNCLMYLVDKQHSHCQVSGLERAAPMVRLAKNLVAF